eukprot:4026389-Amphidinium_carterae.1
MRTRVELVEARLGSVVEQQLDRTEQPQASDTLAVASRDLYKVVSKVAEHEDSVNQNQNPDKSQEGKKNRNR